MSAVYKNAVKELELEKADSCERDRLALYILSISNSVKDENRMLNRAVRMYQRSAPYLTRRHGLGDALASQFRGRARQEMLPLEESAHAGTHKAHFKTRPRP